MSCKNWFACSCVTDSCESLIWMCEIREGVVCEEHYLQFISIINTPEQITMLLIFFFFIIFVVVDTDIS